MMMKRLICLLLLVLMLSQLLCACQQTPTASSGTGPSVGNSNGVCAADLESCARTSGYQMAETETGYCIFIAPQLYYADKANPTKWVVLCNNPGCDHLQEVCPSRMMGQEEFYIKEDRLYKVGWVRKTDEGGKESEWNGVYSTKLDGTDLRYEYELKEWNFDGGAMGAILTPECTYTQCFALQKDGSFRATVHRTDRDGSQLLVERSVDEIPGIPYFHTTTHWIYKMRGELCLISSVMADDTSSQIVSEKKLYRMVDSGLEEITGIEDSLRYFSYWDGEILYTRQKEGYCRFDPATGTFEKYMDLYLKEANGYYIDLDHIIETNYNLNAVPKSEAVMAVYHAGKWFDLTIPEEMKEWDDASLCPIAVSTEGIFFQVNELESGMTHLYRISFDGDTATVLHCGDFSARGVENS